MSTEENSSDKTPDATLAALAGKLRLPAGVTTSDQPYAVTEAAPSAFEEAARKFIAEQRADTSATPALKLVSPEEDPALAQAKSDKAAKLIELDAEIAQTPEGPAKEALRQARKELESAKTPQAISAAVASATAATAAAAQGKADDKVVDINTMHKQLYDSDPEYRKKTDENSRAAEKSIADLDMSLTETERLAKDRGYSTPKDKDVQKAREAYEAAVAAGPTNAMEARKLQVVYLQKESERYTLLEKQARTRGDVEAEAKFKAAREQAIAKAQNEAKALLIAQQEDALAATQRNGATKEELESLRQRFQVDREKLFNNGSAEKMNIDQVLAVAEGIKRRNLQQTAPEAEHNPQPKGTELAPSSDATVATAELVSSNMGTIPSQATYHASNATMNEVAPPPPSPSSQTQRQNESVKGF